VVPVKRGDVAAVSAAVGPCSSWPDAVPDLTILTLAAMEVQLPDRQITWAVRDRSPQWLGKLDQSSSSGVGETRGPGEMEVRVRCPKWGPLWLILDSNMPITPYLQE